MIRRLLLSAIAATVCCGCGEYVSLNSNPAVESIPASSAAAISNVLFSEVTTIDLGRLEIGNSGEGRFTITNVGNDTIHIGLVRTSCTCTSVALTSEVLAPGTSTVVTTTIAARTLGAQSAAVTLTPQPIGNPLVLRVNWSCGSQVIVEPPLLWFGRVPASRVSNGRIRVMSDPRVDEQRWNAGSFAGVTAFPPNALSCGWSDHADGGIEVNVSLKPHADHGAGHGRIVIDPGAGLNLISVPVNWEVTQRVRVSPSVAYVGVLSPGESWHARFVLTSDEAQIEAVESLESTSATVPKTNFITGRVVQHDVFGSAPVGSGAFRDTVPVRLMVGSEWTEVPLAIAGIVSHGTE